jgi:hypothetical protein
VAGYAKRDCTFRLQFRRSVRSDRAERRGLVHTGGEIPGTSGGCGGGRWMRDNLPHPLIPNTSYGLAMLSSENLFPSRQ